MRIAVTSQNNITITPHAGRCRRFWIYEVDDSGIRDGTIVEIPVVDTLHAAISMPQALQGISVLISGSMGRGLVERLAGLGIRGVITREIDPERAVLGYLDGTLVTLEPLDEIASTCAPRNFRRDQNHA
jgi:predicted Fe-Mo cluster-binding NifX family protein